MIDLMQAYRLSLVQRPRKAVDVVSMINDIEGVLFLIRIEI